MTETASGTEHTATVRMGLVDSGVGIPTDDGYRFVITDAIQQAGYSADEQEAGLEAFVYIAIPDGRANALCGPVVVCDEQPFTYSKQPYNERETLHRKVLHTGNALSIDIPAEVIGMVDFETTVDGEPMVDIWATDGAIMLTPIERRTLYVDAAFDPVRALPDALRSDYLAIEERGLSFSERADELGLADHDTYSASYQVEQRYEKAKRLKQQFENH